MILTLYVIIFVLGLFLTVGFHDSWEQHNEKADLILFYIWLITDFFMFLIILKQIFGI